MIPARPRFLPGLAVLERGGGEVQIGLDDRYGMVASDLNPELVAALRGLDGSRTSAEVLELAGPANSERLRGLLTHLTSLKLVEDAGPAGPLSSSVETGLWSLRSEQDSNQLARVREQCSVSIRGGGRLAIALATLLAHAGVGHLEVRAEGRVTEHDVGSGYTEADIGAPRREAAAAAIRRANPRIRTTRLNDRDQPDLVLLTDAVVPAPELVGELVRDGLAHLLVRVREGTGIIGPLVFPGRTSCLHCADLHRAGLDSCWPRVAGQLAGREQVADISNVYATAGIAARQALRALHSHSTPPPVWNGTLELDSFTGRLRHRQWLPHPACTCGAVPRAY